MSHILSQLKITYCTEQSEGRVRGPEQCYKIKRSVYKGFALKYRKGVRTGKSKARRETEEVRKRIKENSKRLDECSNCPERLGVKSRKLYAGI